MAPPVSLELRERIVVWRYELHMHIRDIVRLSNRCDKTVHNVLKFTKSIINSWGLSPNLAAVNAYLIEMT
jgi:hypothetical protein